MDQELRSAGKASGSRGPDGEESVGGKGVEAHEEASGKVSEPATEEEHLVVETPSRHPKAAGDQALAGFLAQEPGEADEWADLSRRKFLSGALVGGAAGLAVAAGTGVTVWKVTDAELQASKEEAEAEIARLQGLVDLYENLEKVGLDAILLGGMKALALPLLAVEEGAKVLKSGLDLVEGALRSVEEAVPSAQESVLWLESRVSALADTVEKLELALIKVVDRATDSPVVGTLKDFSALLLDSLPFGLGDRIRDVLDRVVDLVTGVDDLIEGANTEVLEPLRERWFSAEEGAGIGAVLVDPLVEHIFDPLEAHLQDLASLADVWQAKLMAPAEDALKERAMIREEITEYKSQQGLG